MDMSSLLFTLDPKFPICEVWLTALVLFVICQNALRFISFQSTVMLNLTAICGSGQRAMSDQWASS